MVRICQNLEKPAHEHFSPGEWTIIWASNDHELLHQTQRAEISQYKKTYRTVSFQSITAHRTVPSCNPEANIWKKEIGTALNSHFVTSYSCHTMQPAGLPMSLGTPCCSTPRSSQCGPDVFDLTKRSSSLKLSAPPLSSWRQPILTAGVASAETDYSHETCWVEANAERLSKESQEIQNLLFCARQNMFWVMLNAQQEKGASAITPKCRILVELSHSLAINLQFPL